MHLLWPTVTGYNTRALYGTHPPALEMSSAQAKKEKIMAKAKGKAPMGKGKGTGKKKGC